MVREIGSGSFGTVYLVEWQLGGVRRPFALKRIRYTAFNLANRESLVNEINILILLSTAEKRSSTIVEVFRVIVVRLAYA